MATALWPPNLIAVSDYFLAGIEIRGAPDVATTEDYKMEL
jgi:hypothetical protein